MSEAAIWQRRDHFLTLTKGKGMSYDALGSIR